MITTEAQTGKSYIRLEYERAISRKMPLFAVVMEEDYLRQKQKRKGDAVEQEDAARYKSFKSYVVKRMVRFCDGLQSIKLAIHESLSLIEENAKDEGRRIGGWIKADQAGHDNRRLVNENAALRARLARTIGLQNRNELPPLDVQWRDATSVDICALSLSALTTLHMDLLLEKIQQGCKFRLAMLNPGNKNLMQMTSHCVSKMHLESHVDAITTSLRAMRREPFLSAHALEVRICNHPLSHGLMIINGSLSTARARVELYMANGMPANAAGYYIYKKYSPDWFNAFRQEFEAIWKGSVCLRNCDK